MPIGPGGALPVNPLPLLAVQAGFGSNPLDSPQILSDISTLAARSAVGAPLMFWCMVLPPTSYPKVGVF